jgi:hypothetical protein
LRQALSSTEMKLRDSVQEAESKSRQLEQYQKSLAADGGAARIWYEERASILEKVGEILW